MDVTELAPGRTVSAEFATVGHITLDVFEDGAQIPGGAALYGALLARRCGLETAIITCGEPEVLAGALAAFDDDIAVHVRGDGATTTLATTGAGTGRAQRLVSRAADVPLADVSARILHAAPVVAEVGPEWTRTGASLTGLSAQGLVRRWSNAGDIELFEAPDLDRYSADVVVMSEVEEPYCRPLVAGAERDAVVVVTREERPALVTAAGRRSQVPAHPLAAGARSDMGAGDVFAAGLLVALGEGRAPEDAAAFAHAAAATRMGGDRGPAGVPDRAAIEAALARLRRG